jgi:L-amino acid N-acyltransferase YncA
MSLIMRFATSADAQVIAAIYTPHILGSIISFEETAPDPAEIARRMLAAKDRYPWLVAEMDGAVAAFAYAARFRERAAYRFTVETSVYVAGDKQRQGIGRALYMVLLRTLEAQGYTQAIGAITLPNEMSIEMHEAVGFRRAGVYRGVGWKDGAWRDVGFWQRDLAIAEEPPEEPKPLTAAMLSMS